MNSIKCSQCGLTNWATEELCKRCGAALFGDPDAHKVTSERSAGAPWQKFLLVFFLIAVVATPLLLWFRQSSQHQDMASAIKSSSQFTEPLTVEASQTKDASGKLSAEAMTLVDAGLLVYEKGSYVSEPVVTSSEVPLPQHLAFNLKLTKSRLTLKDSAVAQDWQTIDDEQKTGWIVPVGRRELIEATSVESSDSSKAKVTFTWNWKSNEVGKHFDFDLYDSGQHRAPKSNPILSSTHVYGGIAELIRADDKWVVQSIKWNMDDSAIRFR